MREGRRDVVRRLDGIRDRLENLVQLARENGSVLALVDRFSPLVRDWYGEEGEAQ